MDISLSVELISLLFFSALIAAIIDTLVGGGGLITMPVLLLAQVPPLNALATNKFQSSFGSFTASMTMLRKKAVKWSLIRKAFLASFIGSIIGTITVHLINTDILDWLVPVVLMVIALYFLIDLIWLNKNNIDIEKKPKVTEKQYMLGVVPTIGFYDGFFGPGTGSFFSFAHVALLGKKIVDATAQAKCLNFASNIASLIVFIMSGQVLWLIGGVMMVGQIIGAMIGSHLVLNQGHRIIRPLTVIICLSMCGYFISTKL